MDWECRAIVPKLQCETSGSARLVRLVLCLNLAGRFVCSNTACAKILACGACNPEVIFVTMFLCTSGTGSRKCAVVRPERGNTERFFAYGLIM